MQLFELQQLWDDLLHLMTLVDEDTFAQVLATVCPNVKPFKFKPCPLRYAGLDAIWGAAQYGSAIGEYDKALKLLDAPFRRTMRRDYDLGPPRRVRRQRDVDPPRVRRPPH
jgi:hypothetical protein